MGDQGKEIDAVTGVETTGHEWDGLKELNNPLPRWWLYIFYASIAWAFVYWIFMPSWPGIDGYAKGLRGHSERANVEIALADLDAQRGAQMQALNAVESIETVEADAQMFQYAMVAGESLFGDNCATCHGAGGQGVPGYPALVDDDWLWGGSFAAIRTTLQHGIRSGDPDARFNVMQAYGRDGLLTREQIDNLVEYVMQMSGGDARAESAERGALVFAEQCVACHGEDGRGQPSLGAPNLTDAVWLYGGDREAIRTTLYEGRAGVMPAWSARLSPEEITALSVYVHSLGGGE